MTWSAEIGLLRQRGIAVAEGLSEAQLVQAEKSMGGQFPPDLRSLLAEALPIGRGFPDWRLPGSEDIAARLRWPLEGLLFDIENNSFWLPAWGNRPDTLAEAMRIAVEAVRAAPLLIPIYSHRYLPATPTEHGNPVLSVYQTDIICYGANLRAYLHNEFGDGTAQLRPAEVKGIEFWGTLIG